jgi:hypothetical protein
MKKYNEVISDFEVANHCSLVEMNDHLKQMGKPESFASFMSMVNNDTSASVFKHLNLYQTFFSILQQMLNRLAKNAFDDFDESQRTISDEIRAGQKLFDEFTYKLQKVGNVFERIRKRQMNEKKKVDEDEAGWDQSMLVKTRALIEEKERELDHLRGREKRKVMLLPTTIQKPQKPNIDIDKLVDEIFDLKKEFLEKWGIFKANFPSDQAGLAAMREFQQKWFETPIKTQLEILSKDIDKLKKQILNQNEKNKYNQLVLKINPDETTIAQVQKEMSEIHAKKQDLELQKRNKIRDYEKLLVESKTLFQKYMNFENRILSDPIARRVRYAESDGDPQKVSKKQKHEGGGVNTVVIVNEEDNDEDNEENNEDEIDENEGVYNEDEEDENDEENDDEDEEDNEDEDDEDDEDEDDEDDEDEDDEEDDEDEDEDDEEENEDDDDDEDDEENDDENK